mgnify:CR=1 FL=1
MDAPHLPETIKTLNGHSLGHWDGDALVVDTTNFTSKTRFNGSGEKLHVVERFTRVDPKTVLYRFTVDDPETWEKSWTGVRLRQNFRARNTSAIPHCHSTSHS